MHGKGPIIWVLEDDQSAQRFIADALKHHHFRPVLFLSVEQAYIALGHLESPSLIVLDMMLPGMSCVDLIRLLKQNKDWEKVPVVVVSVLTRRDSPAKESPEEAASAYWINKPFEAAEL